LRKELNPFDLIEAYEGKASLLSRCILFGLVEPDNEMSPAIQLTLAQSIVAELKDCPKAQFLSRVPRALKWAVRADVAPELAIFAVEPTLSMRSPSQQKIVRKMPEYAAYKDKLGSLLDE